MPESTPAGTDTSSLRRLSSRPEPRQFGQGSEMTLPSPRQEPQVITWLKCPNMPCCERRIRPAPLQLTHLVGVLPGALLAPRHSRHISMRRTSISLSTPKAASSNERSTTISRSAPRRGAFARAVVGPPPKNASKMSPNAAEVVEALEAAAPVAADARVAELVVGGALPGVGEHLVGLVYLLELLGGVVRLVAVRDGTRAPSLRNALRMSSSEAPRATPSTS